MLTSSGGSFNADREEGGKICQNLADVICERSLIATGNFVQFWRFFALVFTFQLTILTTLSYFKGAWGLNQDLLEIEFLIVSD